jgi:lipoate-protein ligase A
MDSWQFLANGPSDGAINMAVDEFLLERAEAGDHVPVLRLYSFDPPAITIGYHQDPGQILRLDAVAGEGIDLIRRITGGRALLHDGEITYCVAAPVSGAFGGGLQDTFMLIARALADMLRSLGVKAEITAGHSASAQVGGGAPPCLTSTGRYEITAGGKKIIGSAQRRKRRAFIQHGSIFIQRGSEGIERFLRGRWGDLGGIMTTVCEEAGRECGIGEIGKKMQEAFTRAFGARFDYLKLPPRDWEAIQSKAETKRQEFKMPIEKGETG